MSSVETYDCPTCGAGFMIAGGSPDLGEWTDADWDAQRFHEEEIRYHESRQCRRDRRRATKGRRVAAVATARAKVEALREWREERRLAAAKRAEDRRRERDARPRGVDRVPARLRVDQAPPDFVPSELGTYRGVEANYTQRRAMGQRGHQRRRRVREMPGAEWRRLERAHKGWGA